MSKYNSLLKKALLDASLIEIAYIEAMPEGKVSDRERHEKRMRDILGKGREIESRTNIRLSKRRILVIVAIIAAVVLCATACAFAEPIKNYIMTITAEGTHFDPSPAAQVPPDSVEKNFKGLGYIPSGYIKKEEECEYARYYHEDVYYNGDDRLSFTRMAIFCSFHSVDSEDVPTQVLDIGGKEVYLFTKPKTDIAIWHDDYYRYSIAFPEGLGTSELERIISGIENTQVVRRE